MVRLQAVQLEVCVWSGEGHGEGPPRWDVSVNTWDSTFAVWASTMHEDGVGDIDGPTVAHAEALVEEALMRIAHALGVALSIAWVEG